MIPVNFNGSTFSIPSSSTDTSWGTDLTAYLVALANGAAALSIPNTFAAVQTLTVQPVFSAGAGLSAQTAPAQSSQLQIFANSADNNLYAVLPTAAGAVAPIQLTRTPAQASGPQNEVFATPTSGSGTASLRALALSDLPTISFSSIAGTVANGQLSGAYTGVTGVGTLTAGVWNATALTAAYVPALSALNGALNLAQLAQNSATAGQVVAWNGTAWSSSTPSVGTVTSVGLTAPSALFTSPVSGSPVTTSGTLALTLTSQTANTAFLAPNGSAGTPGFRALIAADLPTVPVSHGGTGLTGYGGLGVLAAAANQVTVVIPAPSPAFNVYLQNGPGPTLGFAQIQVGDLAQNAATSGQVIAWNGTNWAPSTPSVGTVTSVGLTAPSAVFGVTGSPVTSAGALGLTLSTQSANFGWFGPASGAAAAPTFRAIVANDIPALSALNGNLALTQLAQGGATSAQVLAWSGTAWTPSTASVGTVTSVGLSLPADLTVTGSPVTTSGTLTATWSAQSANVVHAGPASGAAAVPTWRGLVALDIPTTLSTTTFPSAVLGAAGSLTWTGQAVISSPGPGALLLANSTGGTTTPFTIDFNSSVTGLGAGQLQFAPNAGSPYFAFIVNGGYAHLLTSEFVAMVNGSTSACAFTNSTGSTGVYFPTATTFAVVTNGTTALTVDASQNAAFAAAVTASSTISTPSAITALDFIAGNRTAAAPAFTNGTGTAGLYFPTNTTAALASNGLVALSFDGSQNAAFSATVSTPSGITGSTYAASGNGTAAAPAYAVHTNYGIYFDITNTALGFALAGTEYAYLNTTTMAFLNNQAITGIGSLNTSLNGSAALPALQVNGIGGMYATSGLLRFAVGGVAAGGVTTSTNGVTFFGAIGNFQNGGVGANNSAFGSNTTISGATTSNATVLGANTTANANNATAIGFGATAGTNSHATALGAGAANTAANQIMMGTSADTSTFPGPVLLLAQTLTGQKWVTSAKTANYTTLTTDSGTRFTNAGAAGSVQFTLPTPAAGLTFTFTCIAAQTLTVTTPSGSIFQGALTGATRTASGASTGLNASATYTCLDGTNWYCEASSGTWT